MRIIKDIVYGDISDIKLDLYLPDADEFSAFVYFHGGGLESGDKEGDPAHIAEYLAGNNIAVIAPDYRMYPDAKYPDFIEDAAKAAIWTFENIGSYGKCDKIYVGGSSAGAYLSMMLCFNEKYLKKYGISPDAISGWVHDSGQPTVHFNVLRERGIDTRRIIIDETAPLYYVGMAEKYSPMLYIVADNDIENRYEQIMLTISTLKHFGFEDVSLKVMHGEHCAHIAATDSDGISLLAKAVKEFIA